MNWLCCQLGAREHYAIPRALFRAGMLEYLLTDAWVPSSSLLAKVGGRGSKVRDRFHAELRDARVKAFNSSLILFETLARARCSDGWDRVIGRNRWFQNKVDSFLCGYRPSAPGPVPVLFSYSYTALEPFRYAKSRGWKTVLDQIDPGPVEEQIVAEEVARATKAFGVAWQPAPTDYWNSWREECKLADRIVVNSEWSREGLIRGGISREKIIVISLAFEAPQVRSARSYPGRFTLERPLRVLFLGQVNLRKGVARLLEAARNLSDEPVEFWMVGPLQITNASRIVDCGRVKWFGPVTRQKASEYYRNADVLILPTLSDGFGITQLEAQAYGLPVVASKFCGKVVENGRNGIILEEPSATCIAAAIRDCLNNPHRLREFAAESSVRERFTIQAFAHQLQELATTL